MKATKNSENLTAAEARGIMQKINWDDFVDLKIKHCNHMIREAAGRGLKQIEIDLWMKEQYVWDRLFEHFQSRGFSVTRKWCGFVIGW